MSDEINILSTITKDIVTPKSIIIGDPCYFVLSEEEKKRLIYNKDLECYKKWKSRIKIEKEQINFEDLDEHYNDIRLNICLAPTNKLLDIYSEEMKLSSQSIKTLDIGLDSASYIINVDGREITINTMSDGYFGEVLELYNDDILTGIIINMYTSEGYDIERFKSEISYLFDINIS